jgi:hypothetical protein
MARPFLDHSRNSAFQQLEDSHVAFNRYRVHNHLMGRHHITVASITIAVSACLVHVAQADTVQIDLSSYVNADLTTYSGGLNYPQHGGTLSVATIPFMLATIGTNLNTGVIQSFVAETFSIAIGVFSVTSAYTLVNSAFGACGTNIGEIDFIGSSNTFAYALTEGINVRDHFNGGFCNAVTSVAGTASFGGGSDRLDMQLITLPAGFSHDTLQRIDFKGFGQGERGSPFLAATTIVTSAVPEPANFLFLSIGGAIMLSAYRWKCKLRGRDKHRIRMNRQKLRQQRRAKVEPKLPQRPRMQNTC